MWCAMAHDTLPTRGVIMAVDTANTNHVFIRVDTFLNPLAYLNAPTEEQRVETSKPTCSIMYAFTQNPSEVQLYP